MSFNPFAWLSNALTDEEDADLYKTLLEVNNGTEPDVTDPVTTLTSVNPLSESDISDWQRYLNPPDEPNLVPATNDEPDWSNFVLSKDILSNDQWDELDVLGTGVERKQVYSNYFILINTNYKPPIGEEYAMASRFRDWLSNVIFTNNVYRSIFSLNNGADPFTNEYVQKVSTLITLELGPLKGRLHAHVLLNVAHKSRLQVDFPMFNQILRNLSFDPRVKNYYASWKLTRDSSGIIAYMSKSTLEALNRKGIFGPSLTNTVI